MCRGSLVSQSALIVQYRPRSPPSVAQPRGGTMPIVNRQILSDSETASRFARPIIDGITERKRAEEQLKRSEAYLAESQRLSHLGSWAVQISPRKLVFWSQEHYRMWGFDPANGLPSLQAILKR